MGIKGLTDRGAEFPRIGELRKGAEKPDRGPGRDLRCFRFTSDDPAVVEAFRREYGDEANDIRCLLPFQTTGQNFEAWRECWVAGGLQHRCDGETCVLTYDPQTKNFRQDPLLCPGGCKPVGRLRVVLPELRRLAYVTVLTTSIHDIVNLRGSLVAYELMRGDLRGIPFILRRRPRQVSVPGDKGRTRREVWLVTIEPAPQWVGLQIAAAERQALPMLPPPGAVDDDEEGDDAVRVDVETGEILDPGPRPVAARPAPQPPAKPAPKPAPSQAVNNNVVGKHATVLLQLTRRYLDLSSEARGLGLKPEPIVKSWAIEQFTAAGKALAAQVEAAKIRRAREAEQVAAAPAPAEEQPEPEDAPPESQCLFPGLGDGNYDPHADASDASDDTAPDDEWLMLALHVDGAEPQLKAFLDDALRLGVFSLGELDLFCRSAGAKNVPELPDNQREALMHRLADRIAAAEGGVAVAVSGPSRLK